jgi:hypothetical protein
MQANKFIGLLLESRDAMHLAHWNTQSYSQHKTLDAYYNGILSLTDEFVEVYFGQVGRIEIVVPETQVENSPEEHLTELRNTIEEERENYTSNLQNTMDEMLSLIDQTLYLLTLS